jgi:hypothetical protein
MHAFYGNELLNIHLMQRRVDLLFGQNILELVTTVARTTCILRSIELRYQVKSPIHLLPYIQQLNLNLTADFPLEWEHYQISLRFLISITALSQ